MTQGFSDALNDLQYSDGNNLMQLAAASALDRLLQIIPTVGGHLERVFEDENNKLNLNIHQVKGKILSVSQFTLAGNVEKGNRPSFTQAQTQELAKQQFDEFNNMLRAHGCHVEEGQFQADMKVQLTNEGPVTLIIESNGRK